MAFLPWLFGDPNERYVRSLSPLVEQINALEGEVRARSDEDLRTTTARLREKIAAGATLDDLLPEAFAAVREASRRVSGKRHYDVQLLGGIVLHRGAIAEMRTGEGKTLVATLPAYLNALAGSGVHVVTVNDYLSRRDTAWMGQIYHALGMTVACLNHEASYQYDPTHGVQGDALDAQRDAEGGFRVVHEFLRPVSRREAYAADITYGTNNEFGFDYLRDNMVMSVEQMVQRPENTHTFAIVDEVDSILIDEARTPLIISAPDAESTKLYETFARVVPHLHEGEDYTIDEKRRTASITDAGIEKVEQRLGMQNLYDEGGTRYVHHLEQALRAQVLYKRDRDYVVQNGEVVIVDDFTGRLMPGRRWSDGLHQAVEAKEGVMVQKESRTLATVTFQNYFRLYKKLSGMTGTAQTSAEEFHKVYALDVRSIPTNKSMIRTDLPDRIYKSETGKWKALVQEIQTRHAAGQPVLVGTVSIEKNEVLGDLLKAAGIPHQILNAKNHEREAEIIAQAGRHGAVTVATNMAGRGVDIILGGNPSDDADAAAVRTAGGLHVIGTERHEARRIDDQLRGRAGRQGDPGSSQFFLSTQDDLVRVFGGDRLTGMMDRLGVTDDDVIESRLVANAIQSAQERIEGYHFDARKQVLEYDDVMNRHREMMYALRRNILASQDVSDRILEYFGEQIRTLVESHVNVETGVLETEEIAETLRALAPFSDTLHADLLAQLRGAGHAGDVEEVIKYLEDRLYELYEAREKELGADRMRGIAKLVLLSSIDEVWIDHLEAMEHLRDSVQLRAYGQRDPLVEYKLEAQNLYAQLLGTVRARATSILFKVQAAPAQQERQMTEVRPVASEPDGVPAGASSESSEPLHADSIGRNDPCPCGSGKKYKKCHGA